MAALVVAGLMGPWWVAVCGIPGHDHPGEELITETLAVDAAPLQFAFSGRCGFATDFDYRSTG
jgi:hypothetical protein